MRDGRLRRTVWDYSYADTYTYTYTYANANADPDARADTAGGRNLPVREVAGFVCTG